VKQVSIDISALAGEAYRYYDINSDVLFGQDALDLFCEGFPHSHSAPVDTYSIQDRVRAGKIDVFKNIGRKSAIGDKMPPADTLPRDYNSFSYKRKCLE